jgi:hypothetical protein
MEALYSRAIPGDSCAEQVGAVQRWHDAAQRDPVPPRAIALGVRAPSATEKAIGAQMTGEDWDECLSVALADFPDSCWVLEQLSEVRQEHGR